MLAESMAGASNPVTPSTTHLHLDDLPMPRMTVHGEVTRDATGRIQFDAIAVEPGRVRHITTAH